MVNSQDAISDESPRQFVPRFYRAILKLLRNYSLRNQDIIQDFDGMLSHIVGNTDGYRLSRSLRWKIIILIAPFHRV